MKFYSIEKASGAKYALVDLHEFRPFDSAVVDINGSCVSIDLYREFSGKRHLTLTLMFGKNTNRAELKELLQAAKKYNAENEEKLALTFTRYWAQFKAA